MMKKTTLFFFLLLTSFTFGYAQTPVLSDNFDDLTAGTFGNTGSVMANAIASSTTRTGWDIAGSAKVYSGAGTLKMGTSSGLGYIKTATLNLSGTFTLTFKAYAWSGDATSMDVQLNGTTIKSITLGNATITDKNSMNTFTIQGTGTGTDVITFTATTAAKNRFLLDDVSISTQSGASASVPTFSVDAGKFINAQSVALSTSTPNATIYYTTDGSAASTASTVYTTPIAVSTTTTIKAIAVASGMNNSAEASATYTFPTQVSSIASMYTPGFYKLTSEAVVSMKSTTRNQKFVQNNSGGLWIDDSAGALSTVYSVGDGITGLTGTTSIYNGMIQFVPFTDAGAATSTANQLSPVNVALTDLKNYPAQLVTVSAVKIDSVGNFAASKNYVLSGNTSTVMRTQYADFNYITTATAIPNGAINITGLVILYNSTAELVPRSVSDIVSVSTGIKNVFSSLSFTKTNNSITFDANDSETLTVTNMSGQTVLRHQCSAGLNTITLDNKGVFILKAGSRLAKIIL